LPPHPRRLTMRMILCLLSKCFLVRDAATGNAEDKDKAVAEEACVDDRKVEYL